MARSMLQLSRPMPSTRVRVLISIAMGLVSGIFCCYLMVRLQQGAGDFTWAIRLAQDLLGKRNPYATPGQLYPLPSALFALPFVAARPEIAAGTFYGISTALLAFGISRRGYCHLLIFLAYPYWAGMLTVQWIPLIMASAFFAWLLPATLAKPQIGAPVALTHLGWKGAVACLVTIGLSLVVMPHWIPLWLAQLGGYAHFIPLLVIPGPILVLALSRYRERDAWMLFLASCTPQRWFYDPFFLWLIPRTRRQIVYTAGLSWIPGMWLWYHRPHSFTEVGRWTVLWIYLPMLLALLLRTNQPDKPREATKIERKGSGGNSEGSRSDKPGLERSALEKS
jgi:hypothetical protein